MSFFVVLSLLLSPIDQTNLNTTHFCVVFLALSTTSDPNLRDDSDQLILVASYHHHHHLHYDHNDHLIISPVKTSVNPLSWPALLSLTLFTKVPFELVMIIMMIIIIKLMMKVPF